MTRKKPMLVPTSLIGCLLCSTVSPSAAPQDVDAAPPEVATAVPSTCRVTRQNIEGGYGNEALTVGIPPDGRFVFKPGGAGFVAVSDGALGIKVGWDRLRRGYLRIEGRRLDGEAAPARSAFSDYDDFGFQATYVIFPTPGCWEITGRVADASLTFVVFVVKIGEGPAGRLDV